MRKIFLLVVVLAVLLLGGMTFSAPAAHASAASAHAQATRPHVALVCPLTIREGAQGSVVKLLQSDLNQILPVLLTVDGIFGPKTKAAVIQLQEDNGLRVDGIVGPQTWHVLAEC